MSVIESLFGAPDPAFPVLVFIDGHLSTSRARRRFVQSLKQRVADAEATGCRAGLEAGLDLLLDSWPQRILEHSILVVRAGERPVVWELPGLAWPAPARLLVRDEPPAWLEDLAMEDDESVRDGRIVA